VKTNRIIKGDCLDVLGPYIPNENIDLIYLDPPFFSGVDYDIVWGNGAELAAYTDSKMYWAEQPVDMVKIEEDVEELIRLGIVARSNIEKARRDLINGRKGGTRRGDIEGYKDYMRPRLKELRRVLKPTGSIYLHCDWHANAHLRILMDEIFGEGNFRNEIVWCYTGPSGSKKGFPRKHETIFRYSKGNEWLFNADAVRKPYKSEFTTRRTLGTLSKGHGNDTNEDKMRERHELGKIPEDWWDDISNVSAWRKELLGYPTQKPEALLERIIRASSNEGDIVLDPFAGGGTTLVTAHKLGRKWIGIDVSPTACNMCVKNFERYGVSVSEIETVEFDHETENRVESTLVELKGMKWNVFEEWVRERLGFKWNAKCRTLGIDGIKEDEFLEVKKWEDSVGRPEIDKLAGKMERGDIKKGMVVAERFTSGVFKASDEFKKRGIDIKIVYVRSLVENDDK